MTPELTLLAVNAVFLAFAYGAVYPRVEPKTLPALAPYDLGITGGALLTAGLLYFGERTSFSMILFSAPWWVFLIVTKLLMELPLIAWLRRKHGLRFPDE